MARRRAVGRWTRAGCYRVEALASGTMLDCHDQARHVVALAADAAGAERRQQSCLTVMTRALRRGCGQGIAAPSAVPPHQNGRLGAG